MMPNSLAMVAVVLLALLTLAGAGGSTTESTNTTSSTRSTSSTSSTSQQCAWTSPTLGRVDLGALELPPTKCWGGGMLPPACLKYIPYMPGCLPPANLPHLSTWYNLCAGVADRGGMGSSCVEGTAVCTCDGPSGCSAGVLYGHGNVSTARWSDYRNGSEHGVQIGRCSHALARMRAATKHSHAATAAPPPPPPSPPPLLLLLVLNDGRPRLARQTTRRPLW
jgi:hypothetical protein